MDNLILLAQAESFTWVKDLLQVAQGAGFAGLVYYYHAVQMPRVAAEHRAEREEWMTYIKDRDLKYEALLEIRDLKYEALLEKCITSIQRAEPR